MNETRFKELLNLHLDHRLSAEEAAELERAMQEQPALKRRLRAYEIMNMGCAELFRRSEADAPAPDALVRALRQAEERMGAKRERRAMVQGWLTWGTAAGAAAVVALMVARVTQPAAGPQSPMASTDAVRSAQYEQVALASTVSQPTREPASLASGHRRGALPEHLTLVALGITPQSSQANTSSADWPSSLESDSSARALASVEAPTGWMAAARTSSPAAWNAPRAVSAAMFSNRPLSGGSSGSSGFQVQTAGYTFER